MYRNQVQPGGAMVTDSEDNWKNPWQITLMSALGILLLLGLSPLFAADEGPQKGKGQDKPPKAKGDDPRDRNRIPEGKEGAGAGARVKGDDRDRNRIPEGKEGAVVRDRGPAVKGRAYVRPEVSTRVNTYWNRIGPARRPFTATWYKTHPGAWRYSFAIRGPWRPATYASVARFVGITGGPVAYAYDSPSALTNAQWAALASTAKAADGATEEDLMSLGVFSLLPPDASESSTVVQLAISKEGYMAGSYYDALSDTGQPINGSMERESQRVVWSIGNNRDVAFETGLENLTTESTPVSVHMKDGTIQRWSMVRVAEQESPDAPRER
jgi:hypothetical protein